MYMTDDHDIMIIYHRAPPPPHPPHPYHSPLCVSSVIRLFPYFWLSWCLHVLSKATFQRAVDPCGVEVDPLSTSTETFVKTKQRKYLINIIQQYICHSHPTHIYISLSLYIYISIYSNALLLYTPSVHTVYPFRTYA